MPDKDILRRALSTWAFNTNARAETALPHDQAAALEWLKRNVLRLDELASPEVMERALKALASKSDGTPAAANTYRRKRPMFYAALKYAVKRKHLAANPLADDDIDFTAPKAVETVDPRPDGDQDEGGTVYLDASAPRVGRSWTDNSRTRQARGLKHRPPGTVRPVPVPPELVQLVRVHIDEHGTTADGRLFRGHCGGKLSESTYGRVWEKARASALTATQAASTLAKRPYTHCLDGGEQEARKRVQRTLAGKD